MVIFGGGEREDEDKVGVEVGWGSEAGRRRDEDKVGVEVGWGEVGF